MPTRDTVEGKSSSPSRRERLAQPRTSRVSLSLWVIGSGCRACDGEAGRRGALALRRRTPRRSPGLVRPSGVIPRSGGRRCVRRSLEDLGGAVAALEPYFVCARWAVGAVVKVDEEVGVELHAAVGRAVDAQ